jgi:two-component system, cell cycle sensor histidine kinase and response regulator CckA
VRPNPLPEAHVTPEPRQSQLPQVGQRALQSGPGLTLVLALLIAALAASRFAVPAPALFLLITVMYAAALGGWKAGLASSLMALLYLGWLLTDAGRAAQYQPLDRTFLTVGGVALPMAILAGIALHRILQRERSRHQHDVIADAYSAGEADSREVGDRRFRVLVEQVRDYAIFMLDPEGRHTTWNEGVRRLLGYDEAEFVGRPGEILFTPEDRKRGEYERELRTAATEGRASDDRWLVRRDGSRFWASGITARMNDGDGRLVGFSKVFRDLTGQKEAEDRLRDSEERLRVALRAARMGIWRWHLPSNTQRVDGSMARLLGLGDDEVVESYEQFREHVLADDRDAVDAAFGHTVRTGEEMHVEFRVLWPDGSIRWLADHGQVVRDAEGRPEYLTGAAIDVTERKTAEERLLQAQRMDAVGHLAGGVAHEINNMMTAVLGFSALLLDRLDGDERAADVRQIHRAAERAAGITRQLLAFGRRQLLRPRVLDLNRLVGGMEPMVRRVLGEDKVFAAELAPDLGPVRADPGQLEQVLLNLTLNARDAMPTGGTFTIRTRNVTIDGADGLHSTGEELASGRYVVVEVSDTGHGMDGATRARAFEPFFTTKPFGQGTGLGLATVFGIVRQSGGTVRVHSAPGEGTTFEVFLPAVAGFAPAPDDAGEPQAERGSGTVLVVEDEELVREFTCRSLAARGYRCLGVASGAEALDLVGGGTETIDAVVSDVVMPGMGGGAMADRLAELRPEVPVLFISAYTGEEVIRRGLLAPGVPFLQKPFTPDVLAERLRELLAAAMDPDIRANVN